MTTRNVEREVALTHGDGARPVDLVGSGVKAVKAAKAADTAEASAAGEFAGAAEAARISHPRTSGLADSDTSAPAHPRTSAPAHLRTRAPARPRTAVAFLLRAIALLVIAALPVAFNAWIDPARLVGSRRAEKAIARAMASGKNVTDITNYDERAIERSLAALRPVRAEVLVLGSSRMQPLAASAFPGSTFANAAMQGAAIDDLLAAYSLYDTDARRPRRVVLGVDPWTESFRAGVWWGSLADERTAIMRRMGVPVSPWHDRLAIETATLKRLASPEYFRLAVFSFRHYGAHGIPWRATDRAQNQEKTKRPDGSLVWTPISDDAAIPVAMQYATRGVFSDERFARLDARAPGATDLLERFVRYMRSEGVEVTLLLAPYPPEVYDAFARLPGRSVANVESDLRAISARTGATLAGSYDPRPFDMTARDFFDESHMRPAAMARLIAATPARGTR